MANKDALKGAKAQVNAVAEIIGNRTSFRPLPGAAVVTAGASDRIFGVPVGAIVLGGAALVAVIIVVVMVRR